MGEQEEARDCNDGGVCEPTREGGRDSRVIRPMGMIRERVPGQRRNSEG